MSWFECKITYDKEITGEGKMKKASESYLVDAETFTEAEARMTSIMEPRGAFTMETVRKVRLAELFIDGKGERFYKAKVGFVTLDEKAGIEKRKYVQMLVQADNFRDAFETFGKKMSGTLADYELAALTETAITDVFPYEPGK